MHVSPGRSAPRNVAWDRGGKLLSVTRLSAGGALLASNLATVISAMIGQTTSPTFDLVVVLAGGCATFATLTWIFDLFDLRRSRG